MLNRDNAMEIMKRILETGGMTDEMEKDISALRDDFEEREGILKKYGVFNDNDDGTTTFSSTDNNDSNWENKYNEMKTKYLDRFFSGGQKGVNDESDDELMGGEGEKNNVDSINDLVFKNKGE